jgi:hypothetical protein
MKLGWSKSSSFARLGIMTNRHGLKSVLVGARTARHGLNHVQAFRGDLKSRVIIKKPTNLKLN